MYFWIFCIKGNHNPHFQYVAIGKIELELNFQKIEIVHAGRNIIT